MGMLFVWYASKSMLFVVVLCDRRRFTKLLVSTMCFSDSIPSDDDRGWPLCCLRCWPHKFHFSLSFTFTAIRRSMEVTLFDLLA